HERALVDHAGALDVVRGKARADEIDVGRFGAIGDDEGNVRRGGPSGGADS
ncbi:hypothetical protein ISG25_34890, partial [Burkholderia pseudomallei]|nr:hypothetical protein [Burkholderia pseudomallei]MBF3850701.1 hypothetical protein [Burkholderia pseudomallei]